MNKNTLELLLKHYKAFPLLQTEDIFKFLYQSSFGCEHLVSEELAALRYIECEYARISKDSEPLTEALDGEYSRVYLSWLNSGLSAGTLAKLFCLSAKEESGGESLLEKKLDVARELVASGKISLEREEFDEKLAKWQEIGCPAVHHSDAFRTAYRPAYRVIANKYTDFLQIFAEIDRLLRDGNVILAVEGGSASGKSTLSEILSSVYDCNVFRTDDFFLRPEQRTPERLLETGGNLDRERFSDEVVNSLVNNKTVHYRPFDCATKTLGDAITVTPGRLTVVEGVYSMHPAFSRYYNLSVFLDIVPELQKKRICKRNSPALAKRFFEEWIPLEGTYFEKTGIKERVDIVVPVRDNKI